jgi:membrane protease YdiL (CAAX protease family)
LVGEEDSVQGILLFLIRSTSWEDKLLLSISAILFSPIAEEVIFRGFLYGVARQYGGRWPAMIVTSVLFAAIHIHLPSFVALFTFALCLTLIYERTRSLWAPIIVHMLFNAATVINVLIAKPQL